MVSVLGICYASGEVKLCDIEDATVLHVIHLNTALSCMLWIERCAADKELNQRIDDFGMYTVVVYRYCVQFLPRKQCFAIGIPKNYSLTCSMRMHPICTLYNVCLYK